MQSALLLRVVCRRTDVRSNSLSFSQANLGFPKLERIALDKLRKVWICVLLESVNRCSLFYGAVDENLRALLWLWCEGLRPGDHGIIES